MAGAKCDTLTGPLYSYMKGMAKTPSYRAKHGHNAKPLPDKMRSRRQAPLSPAPSSSVGGSIGTPTVKPSRNTRGSVRPYGGASSAVGTMPARPAPAPAGPRKQRIMTGAGNANTLGNITVTQKTRRMSAATSVDARVNPVLAARATGRAAVQAARKTGDRALVKEAKQARRSDVKAAKAYRSTFTGAQERESRQAYRAAGGRKILKGRVGVV